MSLSVQLEQFSRHLGTNYAPTGEEHQQIAQLLEEPTCKADKLRKEIEEKEKECAALENEIAEYRQLISSPVRHLPDDILGEIFVRCLPNDHSAPMHCSYAPLLLLRICSRWRAIAVSTPLLWASIHIPIPIVQPRFNIEGQSVIDEHQDTIQEIVKRRVTPIKEWLRRSGTCPLDISIYCSGDGEYCAETVTVVNKFSSHWKSLKLSGTKYCLKGISHLTSDDVPLLENLSIIGEGDQLLGPEYYAWKESDLLRAPNLREVLFDQLHDNAVSFPIKWDQLVSLTMIHLDRSPNLPSPHQIFEVLRQCEKLVSCRIDLPFNGEDDRPLGSEPRAEAPYTTFTLPLLVDLSLRDGGNDITAFLDETKVPSLQRLEFFGRSGWSYRDTRLAHFFSNTTTLRKFTTNSWFYLGAELLDHLKLCPQLTSLTLRHPTLLTPDQPALIVKMDDTFLAHFTTPDENGDYLCPSLEEFECFESPLFTDAGLYQFVHAKQSGKIPQLSKLKRIAISFNRNPTILLDEQLKPYKDEGLRFDVTYFNPSGLYLQNLSSTLQGLPHTSLAPDQYNEWY